MKPHVTEGLREIGWELWDPIGLGARRGGWRGQPYEDEYDGYLAKAAQMVTEEYDVEAVIEYLFTVQSEFMGLGPKEINDRIQAKLLKVVTAISASLESSPEEPSVVVRLKLGDTGFVDCHRCQLSEPKPSEDGVRSTFVLGFVAAAGVCSLELAGTPAQLWRLRYLLQMARNDAGLSAASLDDDVQRWSWVRAALCFSNVITPWIWLDEPDHVFTIQRRLPTEISVAVEPELFGSPATFFSLIGERLVGPCGYAGQDLDGFAEVLRVVAHRVPKLEVWFVNPEACVRAVLANFDRYEHDFYQHVYEIFSEVATVQNVQ